MRIDSTIKLYRDELDHWQWKKLLQQLTFRDADGLEVSCYRVEGDGWGGTSHVVIPRGALHMLPESLQIEQDGRSLPKMPKLGFQVELDGEGFSGQQDALQAMLREKQGLIVRQPGSGKTQIALAFIATANTPTLVVVHTNDLKQQWQEYAQRAIPSIKLGNLREPGHLTIATVQTLKRYTLNGDNFWSQWGAIVIDECFVAGTKVDGVPIEHLRVGDIVTSYNGHDGKLSQNRVSRLTRMRPSALVRVRVGERVFVCTPNHPFWTSNGWCEAGQLTCGSMVLSSPHEDKSSVLRVSSGSGAQLEDTQGKVGRLSEQRTNILLSRVYAGVPVSGVVSENGADQSEVCVAADEGAQPDEASGCTREGQQVAQGDRAQASYAWRKRERVATSAEAACGSSWLADRSCHQDESRAPERGLPELLQGGYWQRGSEGGDRSRWLVPSNTRASSSGRQERSVLEWHRVDSVEVLEPTSDGTFGGMCPDGFVYNLEVEGDHTYLADGVVVHNTHHAAANSWEWVLNVSRAYYRFGFTATERRADGREPLVQFLVGPVIHKQRFESRVPVAIQPVPTDFSFRYRSEWDWNPMLNAIADDRPRNKLIAETAVREMQEGNSVLVLSRRIKHLQNVRDEIFALAGEGGVVLLTGQLTKKLRKQIVEGFRDGTVKILLATQLADEGLDIPRLNRVLLTWPGKHDGRIIQQVGRALRESPDKTDALIYDFADTRVRVLANQFVKRRATYRMLGIKSRGGNNGTQARQAIWRLSSRLRV
jgi:superfamily II DNA or RNA helicase